MASSGYYYDLYKKKKKVDSNEIAQMEYNLMKLESMKKGKIVTDDEYKRLTDEFGQSFIEKQIEKLDEYIESNNNKNKRTWFFML